MINIIYCPDARRNNESHLENDCSTFRYCDRKWPTLPRLGRYFIKLSITWALRAREWLHGAGPLRQHTNCPRRGNAVINVMRLRPGRLSRFSPLWFQARAIDYVPTETNVMPNWRTALSLIRKIVFQQYLNTAGEPVGYLDAGKSS